MYCRYDEGNAVCCEAPGLSLSSKMLYKDLLHRGLYRAVLYWVNLDWQENTDLSVWVLFGLC